MIFLFVIPQFSWFHSSHNSLLCVRDHELLACFTQLRAYRILPLSWEKLLRIVNCVQLD